MTLEGEIVPELLRVALVFARIGTALMVVPGFGEHYVLARQRLLLALLLSVLLAPIVTAGLSGPTDDTARLLPLLFGELMIGLFIGAVTRMALSMLHITGTIISMQSGLSSAAFYDPNEATQGTLPGNLFATTALVVLFASDLHHLVLRGLAASYARLPLGGGLASGDALQMLLGLIGSALSTGFQLAAPIVITSFIANIALGVMGRLVPALQLLTIALPLQLLLAISLMLLTVAGAVAGFGHFLEGSLAFLDVAG